MNLELFGRSHATTTPSTTKRTDSFTPRRMKACAVSAGAHDRGREDVQEDERDDVEGEEILKVVQEHRVGMAVRAGEHRRRGDPTAPSQLYDAR